MMKIPQARRTALTWLGVGAAASFLTACGSPAQAKGFKVSYTDAEWMKRLTKAQYYILREQGTGRELAAVYVPTTPNPTSGYLEIVPVEKITPTDWTVDQAMSFIISGGAVAPDTIPFGVPARDEPRAPA
mgnify:CR=1 FL=1